MDHRGLFKTKMTIRDGQNNRKYFKNKRAMERNDMRNFGRDITMTIENSPIAIHATNDEGKPFRQEFKKKYREAVLSKQDKKAALIHWRPPFISVVPVGKFIEPPQTTALAKRVTKTQETIQKSLTAKKVYPPKTPEAARRSKRNIKKLNLNTGPRPNQFSNYLKKNGKEKAGFTFVHSTTVKTKLTRQNPVIVNQEFEVSDEDDLDGISPIELTCDDIPTQTIPLVTSMPVLEHIQLNHQVKIENVISPKLVQGSRHETQVPSPNMYKSPFVTLSRGGRETKKHNSNANLNNSFELDEQTKMNHEAALKFENLLNDEITRLNELIQKWETYKSENMELDDCIEMIDGTVGQTKLLISSKFLQFRKEIDNCRFQNGDQPTFPLDLVGFWDVVKLQIKNVDDRFIKLEMLRDNDWKDNIAPAQVTNKSRGGKKRKNDRKSLISSLRDLIKAKRQQKFQDENTEVESSSTSGPQTRQSYRKRGIYDRNGKNSPANSGDALEINDELGNLKISSPHPAKSSIIRHKSIRFVEPRKSSDSDVILMENVSDEGDKENQIIDCDAQFTPRNPKRASKKYRDTPRLPVLNLIGTPQSKERRRSVRTPKSILSYCDELHNCSIRDSPIRSNKSRPSRSRRITALMQEQ